MKDDDWSTASQPGGPRGPADDGKRLDSQSRAGSCVHVALAKNILRKGRGLGRGGSISGPDRGVADDGKRFHALDVALPQVS